jgi:site-specific DNA-methyltransferase (adenine-specific)
MGTKTRKFGVSRRESHDSSAYYARRLHEAKISDDTHVNAPPPDAADRLFCHSSEDMGELPDSCVSLMVTSPPYNVGKEYDDDLSLDEYMGLLERVFTETYRVLQPGGRACVNVANVGRKPYVPVASQVNLLMMDLGFLMRGEIIWVKAKGASGSCAWGSWCSPKNPTLRDLHEYVLVFSKGRFDRVVDGESSIDSDAFMRETLSVWEIPAESAKKVGHPAPFPVELPRRLIELYTFRDELILDPFCGAGSTCVAAKETGRRYVGYDISDEYLKIADARLKKIKPTKGQH